MFARQELMSQLPKKILVAGNREFKQVHVPSQSVALSVSTKSLHF